MYVLWKFIDILPVPLLGKRQAERRALSLGGRNAGRASELRKRALDLMGKQGAARTLVKTPSSKRVSPPGAKHTQWKPLIMRAVGPREPFLHASLPVRSLHKLCVSRSWYNVSREKHTICNVIYFRPYLPLICLLPSLFLFSFFLISYLSLTNDSK